jgi:hypothetical protein
MSNTPYLDNAQEIEQSCIEHQILELAALSRQRRIYIAGPMTGIAEHNFPAFFAAEAHLCTQGWEVENPARHGVVEGAQWEDYMRYDIVRMMRCSTIYLLTGWTRSRGARLEYKIATGLGMRLVYEPGAEMRQLFAPPGSQRASDEVHNRALHPDILDFSQYLQPTSEITHG